MADNAYVAVTGATGFIGANIVKYLTRQGRNVLGIDLEVGDDELFDDYVEDHRDQVELVEADLRNEDRILGLAEDYEIDDVIHAAVFTVVAEEIEAEYSHDILDTNLMGTVNMLELAKAADADRFVYVSSSGVYGSTDDIDEPVTEDSIDPYLKDGNLYLIAKINSEKVVQRYSELFDITGTSVRIAAPYGPMERPTGTRRRMGPIYRLLEMIVDEGKDNIRVKGLEYVRDWTYSMDTAKGIVAGLDAPEPSLYNVTYGVNYSLEEILNTAQSIGGLDFIWEVVEDESEADFAANVSSLRGPLSNEKAFHELDYDPEYDLERGIETYYEWWTHANEQFDW